MCKWQVGRSACSAASWSSERIAGRCAVDIHRAPISPVSSAARVARAAAALSGLAVETCRSRTSVLQGDRTAEQVLYIPALLKRYCDLRRGVQHTRGQVVVETEATVLRVSRDSCPPARPPPRPPASPPACPPARPPASQVRQCGGIDSQRLHFPIGTPVAERCKPAQATARLPPPSIAHWCLRTVRSTPIASYQAHGKHACRSFQPRTAVELRHVRGTLTLTGALKAVDLAGKLDASLTLPIQRTFSFTQEPFELVDASLGKLDTSSS